ncbi:MAG: ATP-binding protein [Bacteroides sp.]|nr:ATP-binding protein [Bacteroides sp.]
MKFFDRIKEMEILRESKKRADRESQFVVVTGRRRIGKTQLVIHTFGEENLIYFFVARKTEKELCKGYIRELEEKMGIPILGNVENFAEIFEYVLKYSKTRPLTLFIDEFQDFMRVNPSVYSDMQRLWDLYHAESKLTLIVAGSINTLMNKIFRDLKEPLYNRQTRFLNLKPFSPEVMKEIMKYYSPSYAKSDLLALYTFTGGVPKYIDILVGADALREDKMIDEIISQGSSFVDEGKAMLIEEFGKDYSTYFSILTAIASGYTVRSEIETQVGKEIGGYLTRLEDIYGLISKIQPMFEKTSNKNVRYGIEDSFLRFWFRFFYKYSYIIQLDAYSRLRDIVRRDYATFSGVALERYFRAKLMEREEYTRISGWWDRRGENEIDIIAENELEKTVAFFEVKRKERNIDLSILRSKADAFMKVTHRFADYKKTFRGLCIEDM